MPSWIAPTLALVILAVALAVVSIRVIPEYERGVVFRLGRLRELYQPGLKLLIPGLDRIQRVDTRVITLTIPPQEVITRDNVPARVNAVVLFNVTDPIKAVMKVENYAVATSQIAQTTLRSVLGRADLGEGQFHDVGAL
ncbi:MAG TPA: SPFH domain-containing protein, partial [Marmoricola sp.]|nr:SPFH domain-containing protein [Marmoricola sp.]